MKKIILYLAIVITLAYSFLLNSCYTFEDYDVTRSYTFNATATSLADSGDQCLDDDITVKLWIVLR